MSSSNVGWTRSILRGYISALNHSIVINRLFIVNVHDSQAWHSLHCNGGACLTSFKVLFARSLSVEVTGFIEQQRLNLAMNILHLRFTVYMLYFYKVFDVSCFNLGGSNPLNPSPPPPTRFASVATFLLCKLSCESDLCWPEIHPEIWMNKFKKTRLFLVLTSVVYCLSDLCEWEFS